MNLPQGMVFRIPKTKYKCCVHADMYGVWDFQQIVRGL